jgi:putative ABC transport system permease protein
MEPRFASVLEREGEAIREVAVQVIIPTVVNGRPLIARAGVNDSDRVLVEGASSNFFEVVGAQYTAGRPFTDLEDRAGARVAILGANLARALFGPRSSLGKSLTLGGQSYFVVGELAPRAGGFLGENRQDRVLAIPLGTASRYFPEADRAVLYVRARPERIDAAFRETEVILRRLRRIPADQPNDFNLSTAEQIISSFDKVNRQIVLATGALAAVSLVIGGIGIANVMIMSVTERTREIGVRRALGAKRRDVLRQFLLEAAMLSTSGGVAGVVLAFLLGLVVSLFIQEFSARPPLWAILAGIVASVGVGILAGQWPARRAAALDPVEALRHE